MLQRMFARSGGTPSGAAAAAAAPNRSSHSRLAASTQDGGTPQTVRKELVRVAARDTLLQHGIPLHWIRVDPLTMASRNREHGVHVRLSVLHWEPQLLQYTVALQQQMQDRVQAMDPAAEGWLMGMSWQFELTDDSACPPLPPPGSWTVQPGAEGRPVAGPAAAGVVEGGSADVISGPTRIGPDGTADTRRRLEQLLGERDAAFRRADDDGGFEKTQPMKL
jgi:hypothetical protein